MKDMHFGDCPGCGRRYIYVWSHVNLCDDCVEELVKPQSFG